MRHPFKSFSLSFLVYILIVSAFGFIVYKITKAPEASVVVEAELINQEPQHEEPQIEEEKEEVVKEEPVVQNKKVKKVKKLVKRKVEPEVRVYSKQELRAMEIANRSDPIYQPLPSIPNEFRYEALKTTAKARFHINARGNLSKVELIKPCKEPKLNFLLLKQLKKWKFKPGTISFTQDINVTFKVD